MSGAGRKVDEAYLFVERTESAKAYGLVKHRHLAEIEEQLALHTGAPTVIQFNPHLAPMRVRDRDDDHRARGRAAPRWSRSTPPGARPTAAAPFVQILASGETPDTAHVVGTNRIDMSAVHDPRTGNFIITSAEDNLVKGTAGQAIQTMNLWYGFDETAGLR